MAKNFPPQYRRVRRLAEFLDSSITLPGGIKIGADALLGLFPVVGDIITTGLSLFILFSAFQAGMPTAILLRMGLNLVIENLIDLVPVFGNIFDIFWRSNLRNVELMEAYFQGPKETKIGSTLVLIFCFLIIMVPLVLGTVLGIWGIQVLWHEIMAFSS